MPFLSIPIGPATRTWIGPSERSLSPRENFHGSECSRRLRRASLEEPQSSGLDGFAKTITLFQTRRTVPKSSSSGMVVHLGLKSCCTVHCTDTVHSVQTGPPTSAVSRMDSSTVGGILVPDTSVIDLGTQVPLFFFRFGLHVDLLTGTW
jgi:hypothetical protein